MARKTRRRYYRRKGRWSANIRNINQNFQVSPNTSFYGSIQLAQNPAQADNTVSQQYTVKNVEYSYKLASPTNTSFENLQTYIMYVPQGMTVTETYPFQHPEYIMAYKYLGGPDDDTEYYRNPQRIKSRLSRRLQTGDSIIFLVLGTNEGSTAATLGARGLCRWWTKAN